MKKVLVVDDDASILEMLGKFLQSKGLSVETAADGMEGLEKVRKAPPDVVLLDVMMPKLDGYGFVRELKKDARLRALPVIMLTAREMTRDLFIEEGVRDFLPKPYNPDELYAVVQKYL